MLFPQLSLLRLLVVQTSSRLELEVDDLPKRDDLRNELCNKNYEIQTTTQLTLKFTLINPPFLMRRAETGRNTVMVSTFYSP